MNSYGKIIHWLILIAFLGLCITGIAAEYLFSKEAIMNSLRVSLPMVGQSIEPVDQLFIARLMRRDTWDIHFYFGIAFIVLLVFWIMIDIGYKNNRYRTFKIFIFLVSGVFSISGVWMWARLNINVSDEMFSLLKKVHYFGYWSFVLLIVGHIAFIVYKENKIKKGVLSNMINFKNVFLATVLCLSINPVKSLANEDLSDLERWANDDKYIDGVLYIEGNKGAEILLKEISNCPYEKCKEQDINKITSGTKTVEIKKPDFKKAIESLKESSDNGNALASEKLIRFLVKRLDYKSEKPNDYLLSMLKEETGLNYEEYKKILNNSVNSGIKSKKSCYSFFIKGEILENGYMENKKDKAEAIKNYEKAKEICPKNNMNWFLAKSKLESLK